MISAERDHLTDMVGAIREAAEGALTRESPDELGRVEREINVLEEAVRELHQEMCSDDIKAVIPRLEKGEPLSHEDVDVIRSFLISDAEAYLANENNYRDWVEELYRLLDDIAKRVGNIDRQNLSDLRGVLRDAIRLVPDIRNYLEEKDRIRKFDAALHTLDQPSRDMMARILREQLSSPKR